MHARLAILCLLLACGVPPTDAPFDSGEGGGGEAPDAGEALPDAGEALPDAGEALRDAGEVLRDAGEVLRDAGRPSPSDAGDGGGAALEPDAGGWISDGGTWTSPRIAAELRTFNVAGPGLVSAGFPLPRGLLTDADLAARRFALFVNGAEAPIHVEALKGRFADGSIRSVLVQVQADVSGAQPIPAVVRLDVVRTTSDLPRSPVTQASIEAGRVLLATDPAYLTETWVTFQPLLPASQESAANRAYFTTMFDDRFEQKFPYTTSPTGLPGKQTELDAGAYQSTYESTRTLFAAWQKTGDAKYYWNGIHRAIAQLVSYSLADSNIAPNPNDGGFVTPGTNMSGLPAEWHSQRYVSFASAYLLTGAEELYNTVCVAMSAKLGVVATQMQALVNAGSPADGWISGTYVGRFNIRFAWAGALSVMIDATRPFRGQFGGPVLTPSWPTRVRWILDAWDAAPYTQGYRAGMRGNKETSTNGGQLNAGELPHFQWALLADFLLFYYLNVEADPRLPGWIKIIADAVWDHDVVPLVAGEPNRSLGATHGYGYLMTATPGRNGQASPWTLPMWSATLAFLKAQYGDAKYAQYYAIATNPANVAPPALFWSWKIWGESFGNVMGAPYLDQRGLPPGLPVTMRNPTQY